MSRLLKKRHYRLLLPAIHLLQGTGDESIQESIMRYMDQTRVSYAMGDVAEIQTLYLQRYGQKTDNGETS